MLRKSYAGILVLLNLLLVIVFTGEMVFGAGFPDKPIKLIVLYAPGSGSDTHARGITPYLEKYLGAPINIENISGASGKIGLNKVWAAKPDGYTLVMQDYPTGLLGEYVLNAEYRVVEFSHIFSFTRFNQVLVVNSESWKTFDAFVQDGRKRALSVGLPGRGTTSHLSALTLATDIGLKVNYVPFAGSAESLTALAGKHIDFTTSATASALPLVRAGKIRPLAIFGSNRDFVFPDVPLIKDFGYEYPGITSLRGIDGPPKMPQEILKVLEAAFFKAVKDPGYIAFAKKATMENFPLAHEAYQKEVENQYRQVEKFKDTFKAEK